MDMGSASPPLETLSQEAVEEEMAGAVAIAEEDYPDFEKAELTCRSIQMTVMVKLGQLQTSAAPLDYPPDEIPLIQYRFPEPTVSPFQHLQARGFPLPDTPWICLPTHPRDRSLTPWIWRPLSRIRRWTEERRMTPPARLALPRVAYRTQPHVWLEEKLWGPHESMRCKYQDDGR